MKLIDNVPEDHHKTNFCTCASCNMASGLGCSYPNKCLETAQKLIEALAPKWRPRNQLDLEQEMPRSNPAARGDLKEGIMVDTTQEPTDLKLSIRIFTERKNLLSVNTL